MTIPNNMNPRAHKFIYIGPTGNLQRTPRVFYLSTGRLIKRRKIIPMAVIDRVIKKLNDLQKNQK